MSGRYGFGSVERTVAGLTWRLLLGSRRWLALVVCNGLPVLVSWLFVLDQGDLAPMQALSFLEGLVTATVIAGLLPLAAVVFGTTALGQEMEDGTLTYLLAKPTARSRIVIAKWLAAAGATLLAVLPGVVVSGWIILGTPLHPLVQGLTAGLVVASFLYAGLFLALSLYTRRALIVGLIYVLGWEGALSRLFAGTRSLSVREYTTVLSEAVAERSFAELATSSVSPAGAAAMSILVLGLALIVSTRKLQRLELVERG